MKQIKIELQNSNGFIKMFVIVPDIYKTDSRSFRINGWCFIQERHLVEADIKIYTWEFEENEFNMITYVLDNINRPPLMNNIND